MTSDHITGLLAATDRSVGSCGRFPHTAHTGPETFVDEMTALLACLALTALPLAPATDTIVWEARSEAGLARAKAEKRVVFVAANMDGERACDRLAEKVYRDKTIVALTATTVNFIASPTSHTPGDKVCARFGTLPCAAHQNVDKWARKDVFAPDAEGYVVAPQHVFLDPDGKVLLSVPYEIDASELAWCFATALRAVDPTAKPLVPTTAHAPRRLILGGVWKPLSEKAAAPATHDEVVSLVKAVKKGLSSEARLDALRRIMSSDEPEGIDLLRAELRSGSDKNEGDHRAELLHSIGALSPPSYWELVSDFAIGSENALRLEAAVALEQLAAPASLKKLQAALFKEDHREIKKEWIRAVAAAGANDAAVRKDLLKRVKSEKDELLRVNTIVALGSLAPGDDVAQVLAATLKDGSVIERAAAACALAIARDPGARTQLEAASKAATAPEAALVAEACTAALKSLENGGLVAIRDVLKKVAQDQIERDRWFGYAP